MRSSDSTAAISTAGHLYQRAEGLALLTIVYNIVEGVFSVWLGLDNDTLSLFGFGIDSFIEVISAVGVWHMIRRIRQNGGESRDGFEQRALRITGTAFYLLTAGLLVTAGINLITGHRPEATVSGIVISLISISIMGYLIREKTEVGRSLASSAILSDAACSRTCLHLSLVLLVSSIGYQLTGIGFLDSIGATLIAFLSFKEGREAFEISRGGKGGCSCCSPSGMESTP